MSGSIFASPKAQMHQIFRKVVLFVPCTIFVRSRKFRLTIITAVQDTHKQTFDTDQGQTTKKSALALDHILTKQTWQSNTVSSTSLDELNCAGEQLSVCNIIVTEMLRLYILTVS